MKSPIAKLTALLALAVLSASAHADVALKDDLGTCKLPHGEILLPLPNSPEAAKGDLLKLSDGSLAPLPNPDLKRTALALVIREKNAGDLQFLPDDKGTLWATSGRIVDLGIRYLSEAAAMKLDRPVPIPGNAKLPAGLLPEVQEGRTYLVETNDTHYALVRVLSITKTGISLQYVYQPAGTISFEVPPADPIGLKGRPPTPSAPADPADPSALTAPVTTVPPATATTTPAPPVIGSTGAAGSMVLHIGNTPAPAPTVLEPYLSTHLQQREMLIQSRLKIVRARAATQAEIDRKTDAIDDLVKLNAGEEAADTLAEQITFLNPKAPAQDFQDSVHPAFAALKKMGKPATHACLKYLRLIDLPADKQEDPLYKAGLLGLVIRAVEGDVVGEFIFRQERDATTDPARRAFYDQIISPKKP